uniref:Membrane transport protein MMPL domain-containing protein n=1 Tax=Micrurus spixii TaxID=129469 RepID=A0A2D4MV81_9SAUR
MKLPSLELAEFQVFRSSHPFERYDAEFKKLFMFERVHHGEEFHMPITIIWGVSPEDNGDPLNPKSKGKLKLDSTFNIGSPDSQLWILKFCQKLRNQTFYYQTEEQDFTSCFIETFKQWMENQDCDEPALYPCCSHCSFPYKQEVFELCIKRAIMELEKSTGYYLDSKTPGPRFDINDTIRAVVLEFQSTYLFTLAYEKMHMFYQEVDTWISEELVSAPEGLSGGWFVSNLEFYDLQDSLSDGTLIAMGLSVTVAFSVMLLTTWNVIISLYAIVSIAGTIFVTVGSLVLLGWELNVLESVTISVAVGLSVDFAVHYGVAYRLAPDPDREGKVIFSLSRMGSAIAMAALTTFVAGAMMMPSTVLAYTQLGTFMMLIMCISWAFATFFFQCMCRCLGPQGTFGQIPLPKRLQCGAFSQALSGGQGDGEQNKKQSINKYQFDSRPQKADVEEEHEHYELQPLAGRTSSDNAVEKRTCEEMHICPELFNGRLSNPQTHHSTYNTELNVNINCESGSAMPSLGEQDSTCHLLSQNEQCHCLEPQQHADMKCSHLHQHRNETSCYCCSHSSGNIQAQKSVVAISAFLHSSDGYVNTVQHVLHCSCLQGRLQRPLLQNSLPPNVFLHSVPHFQFHSPPDTEESSAVPPDEIGSSSSSSRCKSSGLLTKPLSETEQRLSNNQTGLCSNYSSTGDKTITEVNGNGNKTSASKPTKQAQIEEVQDLPQTAPGVEAKNLNENITVGADPESCSESLEYCSQTITKKCNSGECHVPNTEAHVPTLLAHPELSSENLLIKTL